VREVPAGVGLLAAVELHDRAVAAEVAELMVDNGVLAGPRLTGVALGCAPYTGAP
jgi:hypothetical protein